MLVRPARASDGEATTFDVERDRWRSGGHRRSFVAIDDDGTVLGHCRGIDNAFHPGARTLVLEVANAGRRLGADDALLTAQLEVSTRPLTAKPTATDRDDLALLARHGARLVQLMPPWRYPVDATLRAWAASRSDADGAIVAAADDDPEAITSLFVRHYAAQHASWMPAAEEGVLRAQFADFLDVSDEEGYDVLRSVSLMRDGALVAQALVDRGEEAEVALQTMPREGAWARADLEACLAALVARSADGDVLLVDSHRTEATETALVEGVPGPPPHPDDGWTAIVEIPLPGMPTRALRPPSVPDGAAWARAFVAPCIAATTLRPGRP